jgi:hypothetical protein
LELVDGYAISESDSISAANARHSGYSGRTVVLKAQLSVAGDFTSGSDDVRE